MMFTVIRLCQLALLSPSMWSFHHLLYKVSRSTYRSNSRYSNRHHKDDLTRFLSMSTSYSIENNNVWWKDGLIFGCTGCGKCCQNEGEVWFDTEEFYDLCTHLNMPFEKVLEQYSEAVISGWIKMQSKDESDDACIFLQDDRKTCSVYQVRPIQCRSYPYWPNLLSSKTAWDAEAVVPDHLSGRHWTPETGGCEGFNNEVNGTLIPFKKIVQNNELYKSYTEQFPLTTKIQYPNDRNRLLVKLDVVKGVTRSAREWAELYAIKYQVFPFCSVSGNSITPTANVDTAVGISSTIPTNNNIAIIHNSNSMIVANSNHQPTTDNEILSYSTLPVKFLSKLRYRIFFGSEIAPILAKIKFEKLVLLTEKSSDISSTVLVLPFAFNNIEKFEQFQKEWLWYIALTKATEKNRQRSATVSKTAVTTSAVGLDAIMSSSNSGNDSKSTGTGKPQSALVKRMLEKEQLQSQQQLIKSSNDSNNSKNDDGENESDYSNDDGSNSIINASGDITDGISENDDGIEITFHHPLFQFKKEYLDNTGVIYENNNNSLLSSSKKTIENSDDEEEVEDDYEYDARHFYRRSPFPIVVLSRKPSSSSAITAATTTTHHTEDSIIHITHNNHSENNNSNKNNDDVDTISIPSTLSTDETDSHHTTNHHNSNQQQKQQQHNRRVVSFELLQQAGFDELSLAMEKILRLSLSV